MANAIKEISIQRGYDVTEYTLCCFGGAGGAACLRRRRSARHDPRVPASAGRRALGLRHGPCRYARACASARWKRGSTDGADRRSRRQRSAALEAEGRAEMSPAGHRMNSTSGSSIACICATRARTRRWSSHFGSRAEIVAAFEAAHRQRYGFIVPEKAQIVEAVSVEVIGKTETVEDPDLRRQRRARGRLRRARRCRCGRRRRPGCRRDTPLYDRADLRPATASTARPSSSSRIRTIVIEPGWRAASPSAATSC